MKASYCIIFSLTLAPLATSCATKRRSGWLPSSTIVCRALAQIQNHCNRQSCSSSLDYDATVLNLNTLTLRGGGFIEINPEYENEEEVDIHLSTDTNEHESDLDGASSSDDEAASDEDDMKVIKRIIISKHKSSRVMRPIWKLLHQNQFNVYILLALIAFRKDVLHFVFKYNIIPTKLDTEGNRRLDIKWSTDGLKLLLVVQLIRMCILPSTDFKKKRDNSSRNAKQTNNNATQTNDDQEEEESTHDRQISIPIIPLLITTLLITLLFAKPSILFSHPYLFPILTSFAFKSITSPDSILSHILSMGGKGEMIVKQAYLPHLEQHYAFEQINERYYRDWAAWRKAFPVNGGLHYSHSNPHEGWKKKMKKGYNRASSGTSRKEKMANLFSSILHPGDHFDDDKCKSTVRPLADTYPHSYTNGTVIVLDMTKLDTQATRMESIRDQISFLLHLVENEDASFFGNGEKLKGDEESDVRSSGDYNSTSVTNIDGYNATISDSEVDMAEENSERNATIIEASSPSVTSNPTSTQERQLEVIVLLESPGGAVSSYGLAASHLHRLRSKPGIKLTICIDNIAASGGYMMACMASPKQLYCAPFAMVGSIGVIGQSLNVQKTLEKHGVRPYVFRGGKMKNPVGMVGDVTKEGVVAMQSMVDRIHDAFREHVAKAREGALIEALEPLPNSNYFGMSDTGTCESGVMSVIDQVANGDVFLGMQAKKLGLVDRLITSDEYISERVKHGARVLKLIVYQRPVSLSSLLAGHPHPRSPQVGTRQQGLFDSLFKVLLKNVQVNKVNA